MYIPNAETKRHAIEILRFCHHIQIHNQVQHGIKTCVQTAQSGLLDNILSNIQ